MMCCVTPCICSRHPGVVGYVGKVHYTKGIFVGVIVDSGAGKNNGTIKGQRYFTCERGQGLMVRAADVRPLSLSD